MTVIDDEDNETSVVTRVTPAASPGVNRFRDKSAWPGLIGERVRAMVRGFAVEGLFAGADDEALYLRGELRMFAFPIGDVDSVEEVHELRPLGLPHDVDELLREG